MDVNWFEGGRRITRLFQSLAALGCAAAVVFGGSASDGVTFETRNPDQNFELTFEPCDYPDVSRRLGQRVQFGRGEPREVELCFRQSREGGIMYEVAPPVPIFVPSTAGRVEAPPLMRQMPVATSYWAADAQSPQVVAYINRRIAIFRDADTWFRIGRDNLRQADMWRLWERVKDVLPWAFGIFLALEAFSFVVGWIIRGFSGIAMGKDFRNR